MLDTCMRLQCLGQAGATKEQIQSMVRWLSDEAVEIYNVMIESQQIKHVEAAYNAAPKNITPVLLSSSYADGSDTDRRHATVQHLVRGMFCRPHC